MGALVHTRNNVPEVVAARLHYGTFACPWDGVFTDGTARGPGTLGPHPGAALKATDPHRTGSTEFGSPGESTINLRGGQMKSKKELIIKKMQKEG